MRNYYTTLRFAGLIILSGILMLGNACKSGKKGQEGKEVGIEDFLTEEDIFDDIDKAKKIFYSLPSPLETAMLLKSAGVSYNEEVLNDLANVEKYSTNKSKALNLGIYTTDLSFACLFDQAQTSLAYMDATKKLATEMGISDAIDEETMKRLEQNLNKRDVVMDIISETFLNSSSYLKENDQQDVAAMVLVGGWIEGLYIGTQMVGSQPIEGNKLVDRIAEQKLSFSIVERMLQDNIKNARGEENRDIVELINELHATKAAFEKIEVQTSSVKIDENDTADVAVLKSQTKINVTPEAFKELQAAVQSLRNNFVQ
ncbi:MAG: hypothetical protein JXQ80_03780 [Bacteroidales bacterium]|nr:hypothetical protein [Bacteroidales bacterium]